MKQRVMLADGGVGEADFHNNTITLHDSEGRLVTLDLSPADVHIDAALPNYCAGYRPWGAIADEVCPIVPVPKASDKYYTWNVANAFARVENLVGGDLDNPKEITTKLDSSTFATIPYCVAVPVPVGVAANADAPVRPEVAAMRRCMDAISEARENRVATLLMTAGNFSGRTAAVAAKWNGGSGSDPIGDILKAVDACVKNPTQIVMSRSTYHAFIQNAQVQKFIASKTMVDPSVGSSGAERISALLDIPKIVVGSMKYQSSSTSYPYVWGSNVLVAYNEPGIPSDGQTISTAKTFRWTGADGATPDGVTQNGFMVRKYYDARRGQRGTWVYIVGHNDIEVITSTLTGYLLTGAYA